MTCAFSSARRNRLPIIAIITAQSQFFNHFRRFRCHACSMHPPWRSIPSCTPTQDASARVRQFPDPHARTQVDAHAPGCTRAHRAGDADGNRHLQNRLGYNSHSDNGELSRKTHRPTATHAGPAIATPFHPVQALRPKCWLPAFFAAWLTARSRLAPRMKR